MVRGLFVRQCVSVAAVIAAFVLFAPSFIQSPSAQQVQDTPARDAFAQDTRGNAPGQFDFYVLALSWSPSFCEASQERGRSSDMQCGGRPYSFVVHGLWPQYERGFPSNCQIPAPRLSRNIVNDMLDLMPNPRLVFNQWDRHGTCSGLSQQAYFDNVRKARGAVKIPERFAALTAPLTVKPDEVADAFIAANPGLPRDGIAVQCDSRRLNEVRVCLNKDLSFRDCGEVARRTCRRGNIVMPPVRGAQRATLDAVTAESAQAQAEGDYAE